MNTLLKVHSHSLSIFEELVHYRAIFYHRDRYSHHVLTAGMSEAWLDLPKDEHAEPVICAGVPYQCSSSSFVSTLGAFILVTC